MVYNSARKKKDSLLKHKSIYEELLYSSIVHTSIFHTVTKHFVVPEACRIVEAGRNTGASWGVEAKQLLSFVVFSGPQNSFILSDEIEGRKKGKPFSKLISKKPSFFTNMKFFLMGVTQRKRLLFLSMRLQGEGKTFCSFEGELMRVDKFCSTYQKKVVFVVYSSIFFKFVAEQTVTVKYTRRHSHIYTGSFCWLMDSYTDARLARLSYCFNSNTNVGSEKNEKRMMFCTTIKPTRR